MISHEVIIVKDVEGDKTDSDWDEIRENLKSTIDGIENMGFSITMTNAESIPLCCYVTSMEVRPMVGDMLCELIRNHGFCAIYQSMIINDG